MSERPAAAGRPPASEDPARPSRADASTQPPIDGLTRAQERALSRCAPLTPAEFRARRHVAEEGLASLRHILGEPTGAAVESESGGG